MFTDPLFRFQTYLTGQSDSLLVHPIDSWSATLDLEPVWKDYRGKGVTVSIAQPIDRMHPDLAKNYSAEALALYDPMADLGDNAYGTFLAGVVAADDNGKYMVGVAPDSQVASRTENMYSYDIEILPRWQKEGIDWDPAGRGGLGTIYFSEPGIGDSARYFVNEHTVEELEFKGIANSEYGLPNDRHNMTVMPVTGTGAELFMSEDHLNGSMSFISAGVFNSAYLELAGTPEWKWVNGEYVFDTSAMGAVAGDQGFTWGLDISGDAGAVAKGESPSGVWEAVAEQGYGEIPGMQDGNVLMNDDGFAAPAIGAGVAALMLEANPNLSWRDVQNILAISANPLNLFRTHEDHQYLNGLTTESGGTNVNGGGLIHNMTFGFGSIDAFGAVRLAETWTEDRGADEEVHLKVSADNYTEGQAVGPFIGVPNPPYGVAGAGAVDDVRIKFTVDQAIDVEHVYLNVDFSVDQGWITNINDPGRWYLEQTQFKLISPSGTVSYMTASHDDRTTDGRPAPKNPLKLEASYGSRVFWGEEADAGNGEWTLVIDTELAEQKMVFDHLSLSFYGQESSDDDTYYFNKAVYLWKHLDKVRTIDDSSGSNTINASANSSDQFLTARAGESGKLKFEDGEIGDIYHVGAKTVITTLISSDGNDTLRAADRDSTLMGGRGNDTLIGGRGDDVLQGGQGNDVLRGGAGMDVADYGDARGGLSLSLGGNTVSVQGFGTDKLESIEGVRGSKYNDTIVGDANSNRLEGGAGNDTILGAMPRSNLTEQEAQVFRVYQATLGRTPDAGGYKNWVEHLNNGNSLQKIIDGFIGSEEFRKTYGDTSNKDFVNLLYRNVLDRDPDEGGLANWLGHLEKGMSRARVVRGFSESKEFINNTTDAATAFDAGLSVSDSWGDDVFRLYQATLGRAPDFDGWLNWVGNFAQGMSYSAIATGFIKSKEYEKVYGATSKDDFVKLLYNNVLGRDPDEGGFQNWMNHLNNGMSRERVVQGFAQSDEFKIQTDAPYSDWLGKHKSGDEIAGGAGRNTLYGSEYADTFIFRAGEGAVNSVMNFGAGDVLQFEGFGYKSAADVRAHLSDGDDGLVFRDQGVTVNLNVDTLHNDDFVFV